MSRVGKKLAGHQQEIEGLRRMAQEKEALATQLRTRLETLENKALQSQEIFKQELERQKQVVQQKESAKKELELTLGQLAQHVESYAHDVETKLDALKKLVPPSGGPAA